ncbi:MAG: DUF2505 domain-containing protein [Myxococcales bacterium]|nr:DUF2505 domain-containing protein [Myxococcales bacterium]
MASTSFHYAQDIERVFAFVSDPDEVKKRCEALGDMNVRMSSTSDGGIKTVTSTREVEMDLPAFAKKILKPRNTVVEVKAWKDEGEAKTCRFDVDVHGTPVTVKGRIRITPEAKGGCTYAIDFDAHAKVPLIGKKLEQFVEKSTLEGMKEEYEYNARTMG